MALRMLHHAVCALSHPPPPLAWTQEEKVASFENSELILYRAHLLYEMGDFRRVRVLRCGPRVHCGL